MPVKVDRRMKTMSTVPRRTGADTNKRTKVRIIALGNKFRMTLLLLVLPGRNDSKMGQNFFLPKPENLKRAKQRFL